MTGSAASVVGALALWLLVWLGVILAVAAWWVIEGIASSRREGRTVKRLHQELDALDATMEEQRRTAGADELILDWTNRASD